MFYNTIIEVSDTDKRGNNFRYYDLDNPDLDDVKKHIIYPFLKKETIFIDGRYIDASKINMVKIKQVLFLFLVTVFFHHREDDPSYI